MRGWLLDLYPGAPGEMVVWLKLEDGRAARLVDRWSPSLFVAADSVADLDVPLKVLAPEFAWTRVVSRLERVTDQKASDVVEAKVRDARRIQQVAQRLERLGPFGAYRLYNADVPPNQSYLYEHDVFPLAYCEERQSGSKLEWDLHDDVWEYEYKIPRLTRVGLDVDIAKQGKLARFTDRLRSVRLETESGEVAIEGGSEADMLLELVGKVRGLDPDFLTTNDGDTFLLPYLVKRAEANGVAQRLVLGREAGPLTIPSKKGTSYFSYGRIHYKPSAMKLRGRIHIDVNTSFAYSEAGLEGLFELSRICRMPLQTSSRASIGKALSSLQFYHATKRGLLIPWKPTLAERFKDRNELLMADRGGFIFEPKVGVQEGVAELDFNALYPNIMLRKNISAETIRCRCCPGSANRVPELDWNVCEKNVGIVPAAIKIIVEKRLRYKELKKNSKGADRERYNARQAALKWLGVTTFGYLGFNNAKFGRIDAHIAVCAWDRKVLMDSARVAEGAGCEVIHGIVDSLWIWKRGAAEPEYMGVKEQIEKATGFSMSFEGVYRWVAFLPSKVDPGVPVLNRYFGVYRTGEVKVRGIEARRHDTPLAFARCQMDVLRILAKEETAAEARARVPECVGVFLRYAGALDRHEIPASELAFTTNLSKDPAEYTSMTVQHAAIKQLVGEGAELHAGEGIRYVITDYAGKDSRRATPLDVLRDQAKYDSRRYVRLLAETCASVLQPFDPGCTADALTRAYQRGKSVALA